MADKQMKLKEYARLVNKLAKQLPDAPCFYASDQKGNFYEAVFSPPQIIFFKDIQNVTATRLEDMPRAEKTLVCVIN